MKERVIFEKDDILSMIENKKLRQLKDYLSEMNGADVAEIMDDLEDHHLALLIFRLLPQKMASAVFSFLEISTQRAIVSAVNEEELKNITEELYFDDMIDLIEEMPVEFVDRVLANSKPEERALVNEFLKYPEDSAGSLMTIEYVSLNKNYTVGRALDYLREVGLKKETIYSCYVVDNHDNLIGLVSLRTLVTADHNDKIEDIMLEDVIYVNTDDDQEYVADMFHKYGFIALPVVDNKNKLAGIITFDDIMNVMEEEATEDFEKMAAMTPSETDYLETSIFSLAKNRLPWLFILMISATFTGGIINHYIDLLGKFQVLSTFIPMLMDTGGNAGSQSSTLVIRSLATGDVKTRDFGKVFMKEFGVSIVVGLALAIVNLARLMFFEKLSFIISITVCITMVFTVMMAKIVGGLLPMVAKRFNMDPAIMAAPLITTIVDGCSMLIFFKVASMILLRA